MKILFLQETDWVNRGPHFQHHILERLSVNKAIKIIVIDYDIDKIMFSKKRFIKKKIYNNVKKAIKSSNVIIIRTGHFQIPYLRRISSLITNFFEILKIIRNNRPDLIICNSMSNSIFGLFFAKVLDVPYIFFYIDKMYKLIPLPYLRKIGRAFTHISLKRADRIITVTKTLEKFIINEVSHPGKIFCLSDGISLRNTKTNIEKFNDLKKKFLIKKDDFVIFFMGYLYGFAGLKEIINYYNDAVKKGEIKLKFIILGDGGIYNELLNLVEEINANWVILEGRVPYYEISEYIELANLCLMSFKLNEITKEVVPIKIIEYMAMKKPVLSTALPGVVLQLGNESGIIFAKNQQELIKKIQSFIPKKAELKELGLKSYKHVKKNYTLSTIVNNFKEILIDLFKSERLSKVDN